MRDELKWMTMKARDRDESLINPRPNSAAVARSRVRRRSDTDFIEPQTHTGGTAPTPRTGTRVIEGDPGSSGQRADEWTKLSSNWNCFRATASSALLSEAS